MINKIKSWYHSFKETWFGIGWLGYGFLYLIEKIFIKKDLLFIYIIFSIIIVSFSMFLSYSSRIDNLHQWILGIIAFPFIVWRSILADKNTKIAQEQLDVANTNAKTANKQAEIANKNADTALKVRIDKLYNDAVTQLSSDKETIRLASILTFQELLKISDDDELRKKIVDILWLFMVEHSREALETKDETNVKTKLYHSQFKIIIEIFSKYHNSLCNNYWWKNKSMSKVFLYKADLQYAEFTHGHLKDVKLQDAQLQNAQLQHAYLQYAYLRETNLQEAYLQGADLQGTYLNGTYLNRSNLQGANLQDGYLPTNNLEYNYLQEKSIITRLQNVRLEGAKYNSKPWTDPETKEIYEPTKFPDGFNPEHHGMFDVSEK